MSGDALTREQIVKAAIELLDEQGLEGLNMRALGKRLGSVPTAVYWHLKSKRDLVTLAGDHVWDEIALPDLTRSDWRTAATTVATDFRAMLTRHPWLVQVFGSYLVYGPKRARHDDHSLALFEAAGFVGASALQAAATVGTFVLGSVLGAAGQAAMKRALRRGGDSAALIRERITKASAIARQFPRLRAHLERTTSARTAPDASFEFGLRAVLDGLEARLVSHRKARA